MKIVGFTGRKFAGKDTAAKGLISGGFVKMSFAAPMKDMVGELMKYRGAKPDQIWEALEGSMKEQPCEWLSGRTPRHVLQTLGTEWGRDLLNPDFWLQSFEDRIHYWKNSGLITNGVVVTDVRFDNEAAMVIDNGGLVFRVTRPGLEGGDVHASETGVSDAYIAHTFENTFAYPENFSLHVFNYFYR